MTEREFYEQCYLIALQAKMSSKEGLPLVSDATEYAERTASSSVKYWRIQPSPEGEPKWK